MKPPTPVRALYLIAAAYDGLLGLAFLLAGPSVFEAAGITPPNHWGYVHFGAGVLVIFGYMFLRIALDPVAGRNLIPYGILLKACYVGTVCWHEWHGGIPRLWLYFAVADFAFLLLFVWSLTRIPVSPSSTSP
jgi:hypothetical protein